MGFMLRGFFLSLAHQGQKPMQSFPLTYSKVALPPFIKRSRRTAAATD